MQRLVRLVLLTLGTLCVALGLVGIFVPLLPTTPFVLLAAVCYARSSSRLSRWLLAHRWLGEPIRNFRERRGIRRRHKVMALVTMWTSIAVTGSLGLVAGWARWGLLAVALGVTAYLLSLATLAAETADRSTDP
jgi:uncharacterized membrane protein YbaN (DUF454 family)